jgi:thiol-disulfide isomerase/thioredoxin
MRNPMSASPLSARAVLSVAFTAALLLLGCRESGAVREPGSPPAKGTPAAFQLETLEGKPLGPKDFPGQVVVIDFWATWCGPCHVQTRILEPIYQDLKGKGVQFLAANVGEQPETVREFLRDKPIPYPVLMDPEDVAGELGVLALPTVMVIDKKGRISYFEAGISDGPTLRKAIQQAGA